ncbi:hypothetical protein LZQ00_08670 [Sphingobacterium sp. SRCM116780]|uniref:hypothetical protein n=1 Tax=Sphingobacterium sp. SRCM116780 TaxID=2907623 RepID=UPI001F1628F4|nr:hypothetical protein [Sphingobacterium sp. SRCM116780]UIR57879.1 hypothetical protein LZQ00_08670 [Sphingobacterium sp. SRCM116780]
MTAIVGVLNSQGISVAADSAVTVTGTNGKKVYNRSNKIFTLSKYHPVGIAIYSNANLLGMPLETLIKMYRRQLGDRSFNTMVEYQNDFIGFLNGKLGQVPAEVKRTNFYGFCGWAHLSIINNTIENLYNDDVDVESLSPEQRNEFFHRTISEELQRYSEKLSTYPQAVYSDLSYEDYCNYYSVELSEIENFIEQKIKEEFDEFSINDEHKERIKSVLYSLINIEFIMESFCGFVFFGFGENEMYPSSHNILIGALIGDRLRIRVLEPIYIQPGTVNSSNIIPYAQADVTTTVLTGVDPIFKSEMHNSVKKSFKSASDQIEQLLGDADLSDQIRVALTNISTQLIKGLDDYQFSNITKPLLDTLAFMGKEDMSELAESLVNITSLKRKFTSLDSSDESVGGPVDVAIVTKGDGFIWMKRKHYFDMENNQSFANKYFKI